MKKRLVLKLSGEALAGDSGVGINHAKVLDIAKETKELYYEVEPPKEFQDYLEKLKNNQ